MNIPLNSILNLTEERIENSKIELNMKYLREISPAADIRLILKTVEAVVRG